MCMMDGTFTTMPMTENTKGKDVIRFMCKKHGLNNETEWGLLEIWDHPCAELNPNNSPTPSPNPHHALCLAAKN